MSVRWGEGMEPLMVPIDSVQQHPDNPRNGDMDALIESIKTHGFMDPIVVQKSTGYILAGNHRWQALHYFNESTVPVIWYTGDDLGAKKFLLADNRVGDRGRYDEHALLDILKTIQDEDPTAGLVGTGYTTDDYTALLTLMNADGDEGGFGAPSDDEAGFAVNGIYRLIVDFDNEDERDEAYIEMLDRLGVDDEDDAVRKENI